MRKSFSVWGIGIALFAAVGMAGGWSSCAGDRSFLPTAEELSAAGALPRGVEIEALRRGRAIFVTECSACHRLFPPRDHSPEQWRRIVKRMAPRASLSGSQAEDLLHYLSAAGRGGR
jgi:mono/diheme cytochrome c family protein